MAKRPVWLGVLIRVRSASFEHRYELFQRKFQMPEGVDADKVEAAFAKGVLTITVPKSEDAQKKERKVSMKAA